MANRLAEYLQALDADEARAEAILATFDNEERAELDAYLSLADRLTRTGREMAAVTARPSEDAFLARLYAADAGYAARRQWRLPRLHGFRLASRTVITGGVIFLGLAAGAASAFSGDPLGLSRALPLLNLESASDSAPVDTNPLQSDGQSSGADVVAPGQGGEIPGQGGGPDGDPPGQGGENPGQGGGPDGDPPGQGGENPGQGVGPDGDPPGQGGENPGQGVGPDGDPPGQGGENPGQGVGPDGDPPGQGGENPGNSGGNGNGNQGGNGNGNNP
jgi:hypothetical protein